MTIEELQDHIWQDIGVRKHVAGRRIVDRIVRDAVVDFPGYAMARCDRGETEVLGRLWSKSFARRHQQEYGMGIILTIVLSAIISEVVKALIRWWLESRENRLSMHAMLEHL